MKNKTIIRMSLYTLTGREQVEYFKDNGIKDLDGLLGYNAARPGYGLPAAFSVWRLKPGATHAEYVKEISGPIGGPAWPKNFTLTLSMLNRELVNTHYCIKTFKGKG